MGQTDGHPSMQSFLDLLAEGALETGKAGKHFEECETCREFLALLRRIRAAAGESVSATPTASADMPDVLVAAYDGSLAPGAAAGFFAALEQSQSQFEDAFEMVAESFQPIPDDLARELRAYPATALADRVLKMAPPLKAESLFSRVKNFFANLRAAMAPEWRPVPKFAGAVAVALFLLLGYGGQRYYVTTYRINRGGEVLVRNIPIFFERPRPAGGYRSSGIEMLMAGEEDGTKAALAKAERMVRSAMRHGARSLRARQVLAQIFLFEGQYARADSVLTALPARDRNSAEIQNDLGVIKYRQQKLEEATAHFRRAIARDPDFKEAYFNLALAYEQLGQKQKALEEIERYLDMESSQDWRRAAESLKSRLQEH